MPAIAPPTEGRDIEQLPEQVQQRLEALGYVIATNPAPKELGVTVYDRAQALAGWNLYVSMHARQAYLVDMTGRNLHVWRAPKREPDPKHPHRLGLWWRTAHLFANGDILAQSDYGPLVKLDRESVLLWEYAEETHHDLAVTADGRIFTLVVEHRKRSEFARPIMEDFVVELSPNGSEVRRVSVIQAIINGEQPGVLAELRAFQRAANGRAKADVTHTNAIEVLGEPQPGLPRAFRKGNLLLSTPKIDRLLVMDFEEGRIVWSRKGRFRYQHDPTMTSDGRLLVFDNRGAGTRSRILQIDPNTGRDLWSYGGAPDPAFHSECCGRVHPLKNGNLLIVESQAGRAFEITAERRIVWEFRTPHRVAGKVPFLNDMIRIDPESLEPSFRAGLAEGRPR